ncbi:MAG: ATP-binding protein [Candidatus Omnitrophica bacterium]|nr:ATP-binding protein [Candidatus Omnitrophota bacterium]
MMRQIVEKNHRGRIAFSSEYGRGVEVHIDLPAAV